MTEVSLPYLKTWYEERVSRRSTLEIVRCLFQGNFPDAPTSIVSSLGKNRPLFEDRRQELGDAEFEIYLQCQMAAWKEYYKEKPFYPGYCVGDKAGMRYLERREQIQHSGYYSLRSEIYRVSFPNECDALSKYFQRWLAWDGKLAEEEPDWPEIKASFAPRSHPFWVTFSCNYEAAKARGGEFYEIWLTGKKRLIARKLIQDSSEYDRACIDALLFSAEQITPRARQFILQPEDGFSFARQVAAQLYGLRKEILSLSPPFRISIGDGNEKIEGLPN
jgi:hypothetical protein